VEEPPYVGGAEGEALEPYAPWAETAATIAPRQATKVEECMMLVC